MPNETVISNFNAIDDNMSLTYDTKTVSKFFKDFFSNLAESFLANIPDPSNKYNLDSVFLYYSNFAIPELFYIKSTSKEKVFKIMENIEISKDSGIDKLPGRFPKDGAKILSKSIGEIWSLSISHGIFPNACKVAKLKPVFKKGKKSTHLITGLSRYCHWFQKPLKKVVYDQTNQFLSANNIIYNFQSGFRTSHSTNMCPSSLTDKMLKGFDEGLLTGMILIDVQKSLTQ